MTMLALEGRLQLWAAWEISFRQNKQGWPSESPLYRFLKEGFTGSNNMARSSSIPYHHPIAETINKWFNTLKKESRKKAEALYVYYVTQMNVKKFARSSKIAITTFYKRLNEAKKWMAKKLGLE